MLIAPCSSIVLTTKKRRRALDSALALPVLELRAVAGLVSTLRVGPVVPECCSLMVTDIDLARISSGDSTFRMMFAVVVCSAMRTPPLRTRPVQMNGIMDGLKNLMGGASGAASTPLWDESSCRAPAWDALKSQLHDISTEEERNFRAELESGRAERARANLDLR